MKIIIVGDGKVGVALTEQLSKEGHDIVIIDSDLKVLQQNVQDYDVMVVHGNGATMSALKEAGVETADLVIAATSADEINMLSCILAKKLGNRIHTIARVRNPEYVQQLMILREEIGLSMTINPEFAAAREIYRILQFPSFLKRETFVRGRVEIVEMKVKKDSPLCGKTLSSVQEASRVKAIICAVVRGSEVYIPNGDFVLEEGDKISVTADTKDLSTLIKYLGLEEHKIKNVMIIGGSRTAYYLAKQLTEAKINVKIIEKRIERCEILADMLPKAAVVEGDGSMPARLEEEGLSQADALVSLTDFDEENIIIALHAMRIGVKKNIPKINRQEYVDICQSMGIDSIISPKKLCTNEIVRYVRSVENTEGGSVLTLHHIADGKAEALEFIVDKTTRNLRTPLAKIRFKKNLLIARINRKGKSFSPGGQDYFDIGDRVILVTKAEQNIFDLNDIFAE